MSRSLYSCLTSWLVLTCHIPCYTNGLHILDIFLSHKLSVFMPISVIAHVSLPCTTTGFIITLYRIIHKPLWEFRPLRYSSRDSHTEGEHVNRGKGTPSFCRTLQVLDMSTLGDAARCQSFNQVPPTHVARVWQELPLLTGYPSAWPSRLLYRRGRKSWKDLRINLYILILTALLLSLDLNICLGL
jgi:hypothetical protein